jgi:hypothetical protein
MGQRVVAGARRIVCDAPYGAAKRLNNAEIRASTAVTVQRTRSAAASMVRCRDGNSGPAVKRCKVVVVSSIHAPQAQARFCLRSFAQRASCAHSRVDSALPDPPRNRKSPSPVTAEAVANADARGCMLPIVT